MHAASSVLQFSQKEQQHLLTAQPAAQQPDTTSTQSEVCPLSPGLFEHPAMIPMICSRGRPGCRSAHVAGRQRASRRSGIIVRAASADLKALIFDCDGVRCALSYYHAWLSVHVRWSQGCYIGQLVVQRFLNYRRCERISLITHAA